jgi:uncharacterized protein
LFSRARRRTQNCHSHEAPAAASRSSIGFLKRADFVQNALVETGCLYSRIGCNPKKGRQAGKKTANPKAGGSAMTSQPQTMGVPGTRATTANDWTPYLVGVGIGVLSWIVFVVVANPIGITTAFSQIAGGVAAPIIGADTVSQNAYWRTNPMALNYGTLFLVGTFLGAFASAVVSGRFRIETVPTVWRQRFGDSVPRRMTAAFLGGVIAMYGARLAGGCTSGNGISQGLQLAVVGWTFLAVMFAAGLATAYVMFRPGR